MALQNGEFVESLPFAVSQKHGCNKEVYTCRRCKLAVPLQTAHLKRAGSRRRRIRQTIAARLARPAPEPFSLFSLSTIP